MIKRAASGIYTLFFVLIFIFGGNVLKASFVWFDIGYTLLHMQRETTYKKALAEFGIDVSLEDIEKEFHLTDKLFMREYQGAFLTGREVFMPWYLGMMNYRLGISINVCELDACWEEIKRDIKNYWLPYDGVQGMLEELQKRSIGRGIISNWDLTARDMLKNAGILEYFDPIIISSEVGHNKPDVEIFNLALETAGIASEDCIYVGDNYYDDALGSRKVGMEPLIINRFGSLGVEEITDCKIIKHVAEILDHVAPRASDDKQIQAGS